MQMKHLIFLTVATLFSACSLRPDVQYIKAQCPRIEVPVKVPAIDVNITNGCVCGESLRNMFNGVSTLRNTEGYCIEQISKYDEEFAK